MINVMVTLRRPAPEDLNKYNRAEKFRILKENSAKLRMDLIDWIEDQGLSKEVTRIGEPTVFNALFVGCTSRVADRLRQAPGVVDVVPTEEFQVDITTFGNSKSPPDACT